MKIGVLDSQVCSWDSLIWETASPRTHEPKIVNKSLGRMFNLSGLIAIQLIFFSVSKGDSIECMYLQEKDRMVFRNSTSLGVRKDLHGVLLLDTALQTPAARPEDVIKLELPLAEVIKGSSIHPPLPHPPLLQCSLADSFVVIF